MTAPLYAVGIVDSKGEELDYLAQCARSADLAVRTVDVGTLGPPTVGPDIPRERVAACHPAGAVAGVSLLDAPGLPFHDPQADAALFDELEALNVPAPGRRLLRRPEHINDPDFAAAAVAEFLALARSAQRSAAP